MNEWELYTMWHGTLCMEDKTGRGTGGEGELWRIWSTIGIGLCSVGGDEIILSGMWHNRIDDLAVHCEGQMEKESWEGWQHRAYGIVYLQ